MNDLEYFLNNLFTEESKTENEDFEWVSHKASENVWFRAEFACTLFGERYREGDTVCICLWQDWTEDDGFGEGGPWGWGGFTSWTLRRLAGYSPYRIVG